MIVVGLETSSSYAGIAVIRDRTVMADMALEIGTVQAEQLPGILERTMRELDLQWSGVDGYAISIGPGSYTGLRVGLSLVKGLAYVSKRPVAAVPTLDAIAFQVPYSRYPVHVMTDARRGQVYEARYETREGRPRRVTDYRVGILEDVVAPIKDTVVIAGSGVDAYHARIVSSLGDRARFAPPGTGRLQATSTAFLGMDRLMRGECASLNELEPLYLRRADFAKQPQPVPALTPATNASSASRGRSEPSTD